MPYSTRHICTLFDISAETVRTWTSEFAEYLSPSAKPGMGRHRQFSDEDMRVLALVSELKRHNMTFADIHASLKGGQRGDLPLLPASEVEALVVSERESQLGSQLHRMQQALAELKAERDALLPVRDEAIRLKALNEMKDTRISELSEQLRAAQERIERLNREIGRLESRLDDTP